MKTIPLLAAGAALVAFPALAQHSGHAGMKHGNMSQHGQMAMQEDMQTMQKMQQAMMQKQDADPDRAFALKMIEHHRAGIAMAQTVQKHGDNAEAKRMAQKMADEQRRDIAELERWLDKNGGRTPRK
ncbi:DUF305 domain-containing protein [Phenylobacterium zucineum]|jgi:uncharacterized protein (DUF305 family)|nr:DUF305 domain-containing protein [Phenylobacterium zucineum]